MGNAYSLLSVFFLSQQELQRTKVALWGWAWSGKALGRSRMPAEKKDLASFGASEQGQGHELTLLNPPRIYSAVRGSHQQGLAGRGCFCTQVCTFVPKEQKNNRGTWPQKHRNSSKYTTDLLSPSKGFAKCTQQTPGPRAPRTQPAQMWWHFNSMVHFSRMGIYWCLFSGGNKAKRNLFFSVDYFWPVWTFPRPSTLIHQSHLCQFLLPRVSPSAFARWSSADVTGFCTAEVRGAPSRWVECLTLLSPL